MSVSETTLLSLDEVTQRTKMDTKLQTFLKSEPARDEAFAQILSLLVSIYRNVATLDPDSEQYVSLYDEPLEKIVSAHTWLLEKVYGVLVWQAIMAHVRGVEPSYGSSIVGFANWKGSHYKKR